MSALQRSHPCWAATITKTRCAHTRYFQHSSQLPVYHGIPGQPTELWCVSSYPSLGQCPSTWELILKTKRFEPQNVVLVSMSCVLSNDQFPQARFLCKPPDVPKLRASWWYCALSFNSSKRCFSNFVAKHHITLVPTAHAWRFVTQHHIDRESICKLQLRQIVVDSIII